MSANCGRFVAQELKGLGWKEKELVLRRKSDPAKLAIAERLRKETTLTHKEIAARVQLGSSKAPTRLHTWMGRHGAVVV